jgi:hypothetical protein
MHFQAVAFVELGFSSQRSRDDLPVQLNRDAVGLHPQTLDEGGQGKRFRLATFSRHFHHRGH